MISGKVVGLLADGVSDVLAVARTDIQAAPDFGTPVEARLISGIAKAGEKLVILLNVEQLLEEEATGPQRTERAGSRPTPGSSGEDPGRP